MFTSLVRTSYWFLPLAWLDPRKSVRLLAEETGRSRYLLVILACILGLGHGLEFASYVSQGWAKGLIVLVVGPAVGVMYVYGLGSLMHRRFVGSRGSANSIRAALVLVYMPVFWATGLRLIAQGISGGLEVSELSETQAGARQFLGLLSAVLHLVSFWLGYVCVSEATGITQEKLDKPATNRDLLIIFLVFMGFLVLANLANWAGWLYR